MAAKRNDSSTRRRTTSRRRPTSKPGSQKRDLVKGRQAVSFAKRNPGGRFKEMDEQGRSLAANRRRKAKRMDRGDRAA